MYIHLHGHTHYSLLDGIGQIPDLIMKAKELGFPALAVTDYHGMYGIMEFYTKAKKQGIKPICGIDITVSHLLGRRPQGDHFITLIAENYEGYRHLLELTTIANTKGVDTIPTIDYQTLKEHSAGLLCFMGGPRSTLGYAISQGSTEHINTCIKNIHTIFEDRLFLEIIAQPYTLEPKLRSLNDQIINLSNQFQLPLIVSTNFHYINKDDHLAFEVALAIKDQKMMSDPTRRKVAGEYYMMSEDEVTRILQDNGYTDEQIAQWFTTNQSVADRVDLQLPPMTFKFPTYKNPPEIVEVYTMFIKQYK